MPQTRVPFDVRKIEASDQLVRCPLLRCTIPLLPFASLYSALLLHVLVVIERPSSLFHPCLPCGQVLLTRLRAKRTLSFPDGRHCACPILSYPILSYPILVFLFPAQNNVWQ